MLGPVISLGQRGYDDPVLIAKQIYILFFNMLLRDKTGHGDWTGLGWVIQNTETLKMLNKH
jgi:hypothetical protein